MLVGLLKLKAYVIAMKTDLDLVVEVNNINPIWNNEFLVCCERLHYPYNDVAKVVSCQYISDKFSDDLYENLPFNEPDIVKLSVKKRRAEFLAGRVAAIAALKLIGENT